MSHKRSIVTKDVLCVQLTSEGSKRGTYRRMEIKANIAMEVFVLEI